MNCEKCDGTGWYPKAFGPDDFEWSECSHTAFDVVGGQMEAIWDSIRGKK